MTVIPRYVITEEIKRYAVTLLLITENDAERLKVVANFSGFSISLLRQWEGQMRQNEPALYLTLVDTTQAELKALFSKGMAAPEFETLVYLQQLKRINQLQQMALDRVAPIFNAWEQLPLVWRVAASINGGQYTLRKALEACDLNRDVLTRCVGLIRIVKPSGGRNR